MFKKKKNFLKEFYRGCLAAETLSILFVMLILSFVVGYLIPEQFYLNTLCVPTKDIFMMFVVGFFTLFLTGVVITSIFLLFIGFKVLISRIKAVHNYCYLPFTTEEIKEGINKSLFSTMSELFDYICEKISYNGNSTAKIYMIIRSEDLYKLLKSCKEIWKNYIYQSFYIPNAENEIEGNYNCSDSLIKCKIVEEHKDYYVLKDENTGREWNLYSDGSQVKREE